jgi:hypothetical protein
MKKVVEKMFISVKIMASQRSFIIIQFVKKIWLNMVLKKKE